MSEVIAVPRRKKTKTGGSKKKARSARNKQSGKCKRQFDRTVKRTGRWRGKKI